MTLRAIGGLVALNVLILAMGACLLWGVRGWRRWGELVRLAGVAYLLGVASLFVTLGLELVVGIPVGPAAAVLTGSALALGGLVLGAARGNPSPELWPHAASVPRLSLFGAIFAAALLVYLEGVFRAGRLEWLWEWDAWRVWTRTAEGIYYSGELDPDLAGIWAAYPPVLPALQAMSFHAMGSPDVVTLHLTPWFLLVGFAAAVLGLLAPRVRPAILLPVLVLLLVMPSVTERVTWVLADLPMDYLLVVAALLLVLWIEEREGWQLIVATVLLGGVLLAKREGLLLVACVLLAAFVASWGERRWAWPRLAASALAAFALLLPWRIWIVVHDVPSGRPQTGYTGFLDSTDRGWPSLKLVLRTLVDYDLWLLVPPVAIVSVALALLTQVRQGLFAVAFLGSSLLASTWVIWANPTFEFTQAVGEDAVVRIVGATVLLLGALTPLLLERVWVAWSGADQSEAPRPPRPAVWAALPWAIVTLGVVVYPASMAFGYSSFRLPGGRPPFPSASECVLAPAGDAGVRVVLGYGRSYADAFRLRDRGLDAGLPRAKVAQDGCGRLRVFVDDVPSPGAGAALVEKARAAGLRPMLERDPDG